MDLRDVLLADALEHEEKPLTEALDWAERARDLVIGGTPLEEIDLQCPFSKGEEAWFFFVLLWNKPRYKTLHQYEPLLRKGLSAKDQSILEGLVCANCYSVGGPKTTLNLRKCGHCRLVSYCGRTCQRAHYDKHKKVCNERRAAKQRRSVAQPKFRKFVAVRDGTERKLIARHFVDGYGGSSLVLQEERWRDDDTRRFDHDPPYALITDPCREDAIFRDTVLEPHEAVFDVHNFRPEYDALVDAGIIEPVFDKIFEPQSGGLPMLVAKIHIDQVEFGSLWPEELFGDAPPPPPPRQKKATPQ